MSSYPPPPPRPPPPPPPRSSMMMMNYTTMGTGGTQAAGSASAAAPAVQVMDLTAESQASKAAHDAVVNQLALQKRAASLTSVPTLPLDVRRALRLMGLPVRLFGEGLADIRQRLRMAMAAQELGQLPASAAAGDNMEQQEAVGDYDNDEEEQVTKYTRASVELIEARQDIARFSLDRAKIRLERERNLRSFAWAQRLKQKKRKTATNHTTKTTATETTTMELEDEEVEAMNQQQQEEEEKDDENENENNELYRLNQACTKSFRRWNRTALEGSQYSGDARALSSICTGTINGQSIAVSGSWSASVHVWELPSLVPAGQVQLCHEDRIMAMDLLCCCRHQQDTSSAFLATASIDKTAKLYHIKATADIVMADEDTTDIQNGNTVEKFTITERCHFQGHAARLCRVAFHPMHRHMATTSLDHTWRLWDLETSVQLLLQDGHAAPVFGLGFHPDGSICATSDFASVVQLWDLRTGKSILHTAAAHAKRILCTAFAPNGFHFATAGDDGTIQLWDLRRRGKQVLSIPAHSKLVSKLVFGPDSESSLISSSFDGTVKIWSTRTDWKCLNTLRGHEGQVSSADFVSSSGNTGLSGGIVSSGFDKTIKYWC